MGLLETQVFVRKVELDDSCGLNSCSEDISLIGHVVGLRQSIQVFQEAKKEA